MKIYLFQRWLYAILVSVGFVCLSSCGKDEPEIQLSVSPANLTFSNERGVSQTIVVTCNAQWMVTSSPDWVNISSLTGNGNSSILLTTSSINSSDAVRYGTLVITADDKTASVSISQEKGELIVSPEKMTMLSEKGSVTSFSISTPGQWTISSYPEWLSLSATAGQGNTTITASALSLNNSSSPRTASITVSSGSMQSTISIEQLPALVADCSVAFTDIWTMGKSVAFRYKAESNVDYFYSGYLSASAAGWTDEKIIETLTNENRFDPKSSDLTGIYGFSGMSVNSDYYLCSIGFNSKGERGELIKQKIHTLATPSTSPYVAISNVKYTSSKWSWETSMNAYTSKYYMLLTQGDLALTLRTYYNEAQIALLLKGLIDDGSIDPIAKDAKWSADRNNGTPYISVYTWGVNVDNNLSPVLYAYNGTVSSAKTQNLLGDENFSQTTHQQAISKEHSEAIRNSLILLNGN